MPTPSPTDDLHFFQETVSHLSGSLELADSMVSVFNHLGNHFPLEGISLHQYSQGLNALKLLFLVREGRFDYVETLVDLTPREGALMLHFEQAGDVILERKISRGGGAAKHAQALGHLLPVEPRAYLVGILTSGNETVGHLCFIGKEEDCFTEEHERKIRLLLTPFALAMSNMLRFQRVLAFQERLNEEKRGLERALEQLRDNRIVGGLGGLGSVMEVVRRLEGREVPVLILGETGTGKELIADEVQRISPRRNAPFVKVNCGAIPEGLMDGELFGYEKGAFTGATRSRPGFFEQAHGGTLFLDEVGELTPQVQVRLLRVLQNGVVERLGGKASISVDVRIIAATHRNLEAMMKQGAFREDLYYRLYVFPVMVPPLRERKQDLEALAYHFIEKIRRRLKLPQSPSLSPRSVDALMHYAWPGNVRELENLVERAMTLWPGGPLHLDRLLPRESELYQETPENLSALERLVEEKVAACFETQMPGAQIRETKSAASGHPLQTLDEATRKCIEAALSHCRGKVHGPTGAAAVLGINPSTLRNKMAKLQIRADAWKQ
ncbi:sigma-54 interaction domain-containing protein [Desulfoluna spongiiphila]|uniref:sigma-54 interaction domain-containing protein n=1 Tax=Desulfoluna spongiiphila TaxID=419481 RepID=UPI001258B99B|nr:sigma-54 dependent transcriptional regulator [Desulfoluna spongiiphila]VVS95013.1 rna polymerase sigma factor 54 interaction domain [Desulfoluna spongiiphila]